MNDPGELQAEEDTVQILSNTQQTHERKWKALCAKCGAILGFTEKHIVAETDSWWSMVAAYFYIVCTVCSCRVYIHPYVPAWVLARVSAHKDIISNEGQRPLA